MLSKEQIKKIIKDENVKSLYLQFTDITGRIKSICIPSSQIDSVLNNEISFDGSSLSVLRKNETMDLVFYPDRETFLVFPVQMFGQIKSARFICDIRNADGSVFVGCPRSNLKRIIANAQEKGYTMKIAPEIEFFLFKTDKNRNILSLLKDTVGYYDLNSDENLEDVLNSITQALESMKLCIEDVHHEGAPFQHEMDLGPEDILKAADNFMTFKFVIKTIASNFNLSATFMPKPLYGINGSGLHLNISLFKEGKNAFYDESDPFLLSETAKNCAGSLLKNAQGMSAVLNPVVNSYKRLVKDYEAPVYLAWSVLNRSALVRVSCAKGENTKLELRSPDSAANPYLAFALILEVCLDGIRNCIDAPEPIEKNLFKLSPNEIKMRKIKSLPQNLYEALGFFEKNLATRAALGSYIFEEFLNLKHDEWNRYRKQVSKWEVEEYLDV